MLVGVTEFLSNALPDFAVRFFELFTMLGEQYALIAFMGLFYWCIDKKRGQFIALSAVSSLCLNNFVKNVFRVRRPFEVSDKVRVTRGNTATGHSFPSGHTQNAATAAFSAVKGTKNTIALVIAVVYVLLIAMSRLVLGVHYITDVVGGIVFAFVGIYIAEWVENLANKRGQAYLLVLCVLPVLSILSVFINGAQSKDALTSAGIALGAIIGIVIERKYINFDVQGKKITKIIRFVSGILIVVFLMYLLKLLLPEGAVFRVIRYAVIGFTASAAVPYLFKKIRL
ncbi:MAG: phosphatase PAP2 family protein [Clostridia bacterium]|nr:phosphatase PAP2 family protein [Clostridia bacterium]